MHRLNSAMLFALVATTAFSGQPAIGLEQQPVLPVELAAKAALKALETCRTQKLAVAVTVVNREGNTIAMLRNQDAGVHTVQNSFNKAFTAVSFGRVFGLASTRAIVEATKPGRGIGSFPLPASPLPGLSYSTGGITLQSRGIDIGAIGVSGSPTGDQDEQCAVAGMRAISNQLR